MLSHDSKRAASDRGSPSSAHSTSGTGAPSPPLADHPFVVVHEWTTAVAAATATSAKPLFDLPVSGSSGAARLADTIASLHHTFSPPPYDAASHALCDATGVAWPAATKLEQLPRLVYLRPTRFVRLHVYDRLPSSAATATAVTTGSSGSASAAPSSSSTAAPVVVAVFAAISVHVSVARLEPIVADMCRQKSVGASASEHAYLRLSSRSDGAPASRTVLVDRSTTLDEAWSDGTGATDLKDSLAATAAAATLSENLPSPSPPPPPPTTESRPSPSPPPPPPTTESRPRCLYRVAACTTTLYFSDADGGSGGGASRSPRPRHTVYSGPVPLTWTALQMLHHLLRTQPHLRPGHEFATDRTRPTPTATARKLEATGADARARPGEAQSTAHVSGKRERKGANGDDGNDNDDDDDDETFSGVGLTELVSGESSVRNTGTGSDDAAREIVAQVSARISSPSSVESAPLVAVASTQPRSNKCLCLYAHDSSLSLSLSPPLLPSDRLLGADSRQTFELRYDDAMDVVVVRPAAAESALSETFALLPPASLVGISRRHHVRQLVGVAQRRYPELARRNTTLSAYMDGDRRAVVLPKDAPIPASVLDANPSSTARPIVLYASWIRTLGGGGGGGDGDNATTRNAFVAEPPIAPARRSRRSAVGYPAVVPAAEPSLSPPPPPPPPSSSPPIARAQSTSQVAANDTPAAFDVSETSLVTTGTPANEPPPPPVAAPPASKRDARFDYAPQLGPVGEPDPQAVAAYVAERARRERRIARRALRAEKRGSGSDTSSSLSSSRTLGSAASSSSLSAGSSTSSRRRRPPAPGPPERRTGELEDVRDGRSNRDSGSDLDSLAADDVTAIERQARRNGNLVGGGGGGGGDEKRGTRRGGGDSGSDLESVPEDDLTALELQARRNGGLVAAAAGAQNAANESDLESVTDDITALELQARRGAVRGGGADSSDSEDDDDDYGVESVDAIRGNVPDMFPPPDLVRWCDGCVRANKPQGCAYIRVLVTYNGISRQIPMPCQPTVEEVINRATDAFQVDAVGRTFRLYTRSQPFVALPQNTRLVQLRTTSLYEFILRPGRHTGRVCQGLAILLVALALTAAVWWFFALLSETAGANGRYGGPWRSAPLSWGGGAGRGAAAAGGIGVGDTMGVETRPRTAPPDGALPFYRGETELNTPSLFGIEY